MKNLAPDVKSIVAHHAPKPRATIDIEGFKLSPTPRGKALFTYHAAIMRIAGIFTMGRKATPQSAVSSAYATNSKGACTALKHHLGNGNMEITREGGYRLSTQGFNHFHGREQGAVKGQEVDSAVVIELMAVLQSGKVSELPDMFKGASMYPRSFQVYK